MASTVVLVGLQALPRRAAQVVEVDGVGLVVVAVVRKTRCIEKRAVQAARGSEGV